jgi:hypothetical protein
MDYIKMADELEKYYDFNKQFPDTAEKIVAALRQLVEENTSLRKQLKAHATRLWRKNYEQ